MTKLNKINMFKLNISRDNILNNNIRYTHNYNCGDCKDWNYISNNIKTLNEKEPDSLNNSNNLLEFKFDKEIDKNNLLYSEENKDIEPQKELEGVDVKLEEKLDNEQKDLQTSKYDINWTKDYKNLNQLLSIKGLNSENDNIININKIKYLVFSLTSSSSINLNKNEEVIERDLFYSLKLILKDSNLGESVNTLSLYELILNNLKKNSSLIKEGGLLEIYYVTSKLNKDIKEGFRSEKQDLNRSNKTLKPSLKEKINLNIPLENKILLVNIYIFSYNTFFNEFLKNNVSVFNRIYNNKYLWGYPFLIIEGLNLPTTIFLFKEAGFNLHGMSITWRHKLSPLEENLSNFLYVTDFNESVQSSHLCFSDKIFTNNKLDFNLYNEIYEVIKPQKDKLNLLSEEILDNNRLIFESEKILQDGMKTNIPFPKKHYEKIKNNNLYKKEFNIRKYLKIKKNTISPIVLILILRNHILDLEKKKDEIFNQKSNLLSAIDNLNDDIQTWIKTQDNLEVITKNLLDKKIKLELEIKNKEKELNTILLEQTETKKINSINKNSRRDLIKKTKDKKKKNLLKNKLRPDMTYFEATNNKRIKEENLLKKIKLEEKEISLQYEDQIKEKKINLNNLETNIQKRNNLNLELEKFKEKSDIIEKRFNVEKDLPFSKAVLDSINNRNRSNYIKKKDSFNKDVNISPIDISKRKFSTITKNKDSGLYFDSPVFVELKRFIDNYPINEETQITIEKYLLELNINVTLEKINQELKINYSRLNPLVTSHLGKHIEEISNLIDNYRKNLINLGQDNNMKLINSYKVESQIILRLDNEKILSLLLGRLLRIISYNKIYEKNNCTQIAKDLGEALLWEFFYLEHMSYLKETENFEKNKDLTNPNKYRNSLNLFIKNNKNLLIFKEKVSDENLIQMGLRLLNFLVETNLLKTEVQQIDKNIKLHVYVPTSNITDKIRESLESFNLSNYIPMLIEPKKYYFDNKTKEEILGGYFLNDVKYIEPLIIKKNDLEESSTIEEENKIYDLVNNLNSTGFKINNQVLNFILSEGIKFNLISDFNNPHPLEIKTKNSKDKLTLQEKKKLESFLSKRFLEKNIIGLALIFQNVNEFFIPVRLDNRGRVYCVVDYLNYQGIELAKSLLLFSKEEKIFLSDITAINYLKIYGANCYGNGIDKNSFSDRLNWVDQNEEEILNFENGKLLKLAENKLLFIAFCFEYKKYHNSKSTEKPFYFSNFPIKLDATCNGFQHFSLMLGDVNMAEKVNLNPTVMDKAPMDLYLYLTVKVKERLELMVIKDNLEKKDNIKNELNWGKDKDKQKENLKRKEIIESCKKWLKIKIYRKLVKTSVMVIPYNASIISRADYLKQQFKVVEIKGNLYHKSEEGILFNNYDFIIYASIIDKVMANEFPKLKEFNDYLNKIGNICSKLNLPIIWTLPSGLVVKQKYLKTEAIELKPFKYSNSRFKLNKTMKQINEFKQKRALMPNLVHSLDGASLCLLVDSFYNIYNNNNKVKIDTNFYAIHDCFATTYNKFEDLINLLKAVYIKIYIEDDFLIKFDKDIQDYIKSIYGKNSLKNNKLEIFNENGVNIINFPNVQDIILGKIAASNICNSHAGLN
jgi:DNA-directed RNA polymerase